MYKVLYRKYRPQTFDELVGQDYITTSLKNQVQSGEISHAYLFTGSRGTGKTSMAKLFARAINCTDSKNGSPCFKCESCKSLNDENNMDVVEIDAASNNRVDEVRDIREKVKFLPVMCKYKVYIIDEVHMLTESAFNALLKTLEEPPSHVVFILATTEVHKLPKTIISRCMRFDFNLIEDSVLKNHLQNIFANEKVQCESEALDLIVKAAEGSVRDLLSIADCVFAFSQNSIKTQDVMNVLGNSNMQVYLEIAFYIHKKQLDKAFKVLHEENKKSRNMSMFAKQLTKTFRDLLVVKTCSDANEIINVTAELFEKYEKTAQSMSVYELMEYMKIFSFIESEIKYALSPKTLIETAIVTAVSEVDEKKNG